ncbi:ABC transporter permease, partial [Agathobaculum sp.]|uniref:ABC transporter permease n=1 Tax=Agathobaculum sp. TaxID=2048138 RepID=UPI003AB45385
MVKSFLSFVKDIIRERKLIFELAKNDFKAKYAGSFLGVVWAFVQPLVTVLVMWFVFEKGFRSKPVDDVPFILWFVPAYIPWIFFSDMLASTTNCLYEYSYLVKKVKFRVSVLPIVKIMSATFVHLFFIVFIFAI